MARKMAAKAGIECGFFCTELGLWLWPKNGREIGEVKWSVILTRSVRSIRFVVASSAKGMMGSAAGATEPRWRRHIASASPEKARKFQQLKVAYDTVIIDNIKDGSSRDYPRFDTSVKEKIIFLTPLLLIIEVYVFSTIRVNYVFA
ncbi:hypothetical protein TcasGA2_TC006562 [Tribolium castaneum]|uniref:Uncharacterized protein n=1 Tax=Tribolium castaneum TaxID=7070 RepID=D6WXK8_TRICA|nr:hypothetical protein TcasGA2_TC006562 [Tribolium castaneum]